MAENLTTKILNSHLLNSVSPAKEDVGCHPGSSPAIAVSAEQILQAMPYADHNTVQLDFRNALDHLERYARPGQVLIGADRHTTAAGAVGMLAIGASGLEVAVTLTGLPFEFERPRVIGVELLGELCEGVGADDVWRELARRRRLHSSDERAPIFEFFGDGVDSLGVPERARICDAITELGGAAALFPSDRRAREWLTDRERGEDWTELRADDEASYDEIELIELDLLSPGEVELQSVRESFALPAPLRYPLPESWTGGLLVGGENYGLGSSREPALLVPKYLGVRAVVAKSFSRLHRRDLILHGVLPLIFERTADFERLVHGEDWEFHGVRERLEQGESLIEARNVTTGEKVRLIADLSVRERVILLDGGLVSHLKGTLPAPVFPFDLTDPAIPFAA